MAKDIAITTIHTQAKDIALLIKDNAKQREYSALTLYHATVHTGFFHFHTGMRIGMIPV
jgi:hypothetical protein